MMIRNILILFFVSLVLPVFAQSKKVSKKKKDKNEVVLPKAYTNDILVDNIRTVKFHIDGFPLTEPIVNLGSSTKLLLSFDDIQLEAKNYTYSIELCNADWTPNEEVNVFDYINGFDEDRITEYGFSRTRFSEYVHYTLKLPNSRVSWKLSGNYILKVFLDEDEKDLVLTRRFMVTENLVFINPIVNVASRSNQNRTHQEVDFVLTYQKLNIKNPIAEITATVLQNGRWDNAITNIKPLYIKEKELKFDYQGKICFEAGKEWRYVDMRSLENRLNFVERIERLEEGFDVFVQRERRRSNQNYFNNRDANGKFVIENFDDLSYRSLRSLPSIDTTTVSGADLTEEQRTNRANEIDILNRFNQTDIDKARNDQAIVSEYVLTYFTLDIPQKIYDGEVYIFGELSDWKIKDAFKLRYNQDLFQYETEIFLKQGYYNYMYVFVPNNKGEGLAYSFEEVEGNWFETENNYQILVYFRPFGQRYDQLIGAKTTGSLKR